MGLFRVGNLKQNVPFTREKYSVARFSIESELSTCTTFQSAAEVTFKLLHILRDYI